MKRLVRRLMAPHHHMAKLVKKDDLAGFFQSVKPVGSRNELIRVGPAGDGGYLLPDDLDGLVGCISPGVDVESRFDLEMAERGVPVFMADASVVGPAIEHPDFHFWPLFLDVTETDRTTRLDTFVGKAPPEGDLILQMDIEGAEFPVLLDTSPATLERFRMMVIEFHALEQIFCRFSFRQINAVFQKILRSHDVVHIHPNNYGGKVSRLGYEVTLAMEFTFYRRDRNAPPHHAHPGFPHPLDADNLTTFPHVTLPDCWWR